MFEKSAFENLVNPESAENVADKKEIINDNMDKMSLTFSLEKFKHQEGRDFSYFFEKYSTLFCDLKKLVSRHDKDKSEEIIDSIEGEVKEMIDNGREGEVYDYLKQKKEEFKEEKENRDNKKEKFGLLKYTIDGIEKGEDMRKVFEELGFGEYDEVLSAHIEEAYRHDGAIIFRKGFSDLAVKIKKEFPSIKAVIGRSWLVDTPIAERLGFKKIDVELSQNNPNTWLQFIDQDGRISDRRFEALLESGEIPHKNSAAYIAVEDFLRRYLPEEERGEIVLKDVNEKWCEDFAPIEKGFVWLKKNWESIGSVDELKRCFDGELSSVIDFIGKYQEFDGLSDLLLELKGEKLSWVQLRERSDFVAYGKAVDEFVAKNKYSERVVNI